MEAAAIVKKQHVVKILGIRRENKSEWERRCALTPNEVRKLKSELGTQIEIRV